MKISIITVCLNNIRTIIHTLNSVLTQDYKNIEHVLVDGGSTDGTLELINKYPFRNKKIIYQKKTGIYNAMNLGISEATGDLICILNADDIFNSIYTIKEVVKQIKKKPNFDVYLGSVVFFNDENFKKISRHYDAAKFHTKLLKYGIMPPHPGAFIRKEIYSKNYLYKENFQIASDFEFFLRIFFLKKHSFCIMKTIITRMKTGGISGKDIFSYAISTFEIIKSFKINKIKFNLFYIILRFPAKFPQFILFDQKKINKSYKIKFSRFLNKNYKYDFNLVTKIKRINLKKNIILSAMNLAFLGCFSKGQILKNKNMINWPDGIFSKIFKNKINKIPGRDIIRKIKLPKNITEIIVLGNLDNVGKIFLEKKFKISIKQIKLPFDTAENIIKKLNLHVKKNQLVLITLPTPKQEIIANHLSNINKNYKIICIGGSIAIASGSEKKVPQLISNFEFIWRLRYDTLRRLKRLFYTFIYFLNGYFISKKLRYLRIQII